MNMNKKLDRLRQWAGERMGGEVKTEASDDFKSLEQEMNLRQDGMDKLHSTMNVYIKSMSKRKEGDDREKMLPIEVLAQAMIYHGEEFEPDSLFGNCLIKMGQANEKIARVQDSYITTASESWLESLERSLAQMKEYQAARRKLESRRLAYDATLSKIQKQKREDFRVEEELRAQRIKYEESSEDVYRRMGDIQDSEAESMAELGAFMDAELEYHDRCREILQSLRRNWPAAAQANSLKKSRSRSNTAHSFHNGTREESPPPPLPQSDRPSIRSRVNTNNTGGSPVSDHGARPFRLPTPDHHDNLTSKPVFHRTNTSPQARYESTSSERMARTNSDQSSPLILPKTRGLHGENNHSSSYNSSDRYTQDDRSTSPARSVGSIGSRAVSRVSSQNALSNSYDANSARKVPPPPPASRIIKKPPPPPPPMKKSQLSTTHQN